MVTIEEVVLTPDIVIAAGGNVAVGNYRLVGELTVTNSGIGQTIRLESVEGSVAGADWKFVNLRAVVDGPNGTMLTSVGYDPNAKITWRLVLKDIKTRTDTPLGSVIQAGQTRNPTYVAFKKINTATTPGFRALGSFLRWGCGNAAAGTPTEQGVVNAVWAAFSGLKLKDVEDKPVVYYATWTVQSHNANSVLNRDVIQSLLYDVNCVTLSMYMVSALRAQGLEYADNVMVAVGKEVRTATQNGQVLTFAPPLNEIIFVKSWQPKAQNIKTTTLVGYDWTNITAATTLYKLNAKVWNYTWAQEEIGKVQNQLPGQNNSNPLAIFVDHYMVQLKIGNGIASLYDPSYGEKYLNLADFETKSIAYFGLLQGRIIAIRENGAAADLSRLVTVPNTGEDITRY